MSIYTAVQNLVPNGQITPIFNPQIFNVASNTTITVAQAQISGDLNVGGTSTIDGETLLQALEVRTTTQLNELEVYSNAKFFGNIEVPTLPQKTNNDLVATTKYCDLAVSNLINGSPQLLDTLSELSQALNNDNNFASNITNLISTKAGLTQSNTFSNTNTFNAPINFTNTINNVDVNTFSLIGNLTDDAQEQINNLVENITNLNDTKANLTYVEQADQTLQTNINTTQTNLQGQIDNLSNIKANLSYVEQADNLLQSNINSTQINLQGQIDSLNTNKSNLSYVQQVDSGLQNNLNTVQSTLQGQIDNLSNVKANLLYVSQSDELLQSQIDTKASSVYVDGIKTTLENSISALETTTNNTLATKATISYVDNINTQLNTSINTLDTNLQSQINTLDLEKATILYVDGIETSILNNISSLESNVNSQITNLSNNKADITYVDTSINNLIGGASGAYDTLVELQNALLNNNDTVTSITNTLATKATISYVDNADTNLQTQITNLSSTKANQLYVEQSDQTLQTNINNLQTNLQGQINTLGTSKANISYVDTADQTLQTNINNLQTSINSSLATKASIADLDTLRTDTNTTLDNFNATKLDTSEFNYYLGTLQSDLATKASQSYVDSQLFNKASKTELSNEVSNLQNAINSLSSNKADISYIDNVVSNLVGSAPETLNTLSEIANALGEDANYSTTISNLIGTKANSSDVSSSITNLQSQINSKANTQYVSDQLDLKANKTYVDSVDALLQADLDTKATLSYVNAQLDTKASISYVDQQIASIPSGGGGSGGSVDVSGKADITYVDNADTNLQNQITSLDTNKTSKTYVDTADGLLQTQINNLGTSKATYTYVDNAVSNLVGSAPEALNTLQELSQALGSDPNFSTTVINSLATKANDNEVVKLSGAQTIAGVKTFSSNVIVPSLNGISSSTLGFLDATSSIQTQLNGKLNNGSAMTLSGNETITGQKIWSNTNYFNGRMVEGIQTIITTSATYSFDWTTLTGAILNFSAPNSANMTLSLTNVPLTSSGIYNITMCINTATNKVRFSTINVNGTSRSIVYLGGSSSINIASASVVFQTFNIFVVDNNVATVLSSVASYSA